jgi:hypothetical protein
MRPELVCWLILQRAPLGDDALQPELASARAGRAASITAPSSLKRYKRAAKLLTSLDNANIKDEPYTVWGDLQQLERLDRYEHRARPRRDRAIKEFGYMRTKAISI